MNSEMQKCAINGCLTFMPRRVYIGDKVYHITNDKCREHS